MKCTRQGAGGQLDPRGDTSSKAHQIFLGGPLQDPQYNMSIQGMVKQLRNEHLLKGGSLRGNGGGGGGGRCHTFACMLAVHLGLDTYEGVDL